MFVISPKKSKKCVSKELKKKLGIVELAKETEVLNENGGDRKSESVLQNEKCNTEKQGNSSKYRIAKLKRDYPEIVSEKEVYIEKSDNI